MNKSEEMIIYHQEAITDAWLEEQGKKYRSNTENKVIEENLSQNPSRRSPL